jgi:hypothetical protein
MSSPNNGCIRLANVETSTVTSTSTIPQGAIITRYDIDCTQGGDDGEDYSPSTCSMNIGLAANQQSNVIAGDVPAPSGHQKRHAPLLPAARATATRAMLRARFRRSRDLCSSGP